MRNEPAPAPHVIFCFLAWLLFTTLPSIQFFAADWPTYRHDCKRSGTTGEGLQPPLSLHWVLKPTHPPKPAWPPPAEEMPRMHEDNAFHVTASHGRVFFGSSVDNKVYAADAVSGRILWAFCTQGPVRFAPFLYEGRIYFGSDDGYVYCLGAGDGRLAWKHRAGPSGEKVVGNGRIISIWPVRTSLLVDDGQVFFGAGVFPYEGIYICALKAEDGSVLWINDTVGDRAHDLYYGGVSPHGYLVASQDVLFVPSGRAMPAAFDRRTGRFLYYAPPGAKRGGTWALLDNENLVAGVDLSGTPQKVAYEAGTGVPKGTLFAWFPGIDMVVTPRFSYILTRAGIYAIERAAYAVAEAKANDALKKGEEMRGLLSKLREKQARADEQERERIDGEISQLAREIHILNEEVRNAKASSSMWSYPKENLCTLILAGNALFAGGDGFVVAVDSKTGEELWDENVEGKACGLAVAEERLFVSTESGPVYCFGSTKAPEGKEIRTPLLADPYPQDSLTDAYGNAAGKIVQETGIQKGFCLIVDCGEGRLAFELARRTELQIVGIEMDGAKVQAGREKLELAGLWGDRVVLEPWRMEDLPPYFANLVVLPMESGSRQMEIPEFVLRVLRPCGGTVVSLRGADPRSWAWSLFVRGKLEGAGSWTQLYGNPQNTSCSGDQLVKGPFGVLWFGEPGPKDMVDRHGRACGPVSMNGRLFHQGEEVIMAVDAYNGTPLWKRRIPGAVRVRVDVDGGNLALTEEGLYVAVHDQCLRLDPDTGKTVREYSLPPSPDGTPRRWGFLAAEGGRLFGSTAPPLKTEYGVMWKDFVDEEKAEWRTEEEIAAAGSGMEEDAERYRSLYRDYRARYPVAGEDLYMDFHRAGHLWNSMERFPVWGGERTPKGALSSRIMASDSLFAMDADTGELLWTHRGEVIPHISVSFGRKVIYFVESAASEKERALALREKEALIEEGIYEEGSEARILAPEDADVRIVVALDAATGKPLWKKPIDLSGCGGDKMGSAWSDGVLLFFGHFSNHDTGFFLGNELTWRRVTALDSSTGRMIWSRPLNYLRRPLIVGDTLIIEPRACDLRTGRIRARPHPVSGQPVPWEFLRPGHCCGITSASAHTLFYRSYFSAIYELTGDKGLSLFGGIRPGCWLNMIPCNGLMIMPEASSGCTCSFPLRCSFALVSKPEKKEGSWTVFITHGPAKPVRHLAINLGAAGDMRDGEGTLWLAYPRPVVVSPIGYGNYAMPVELNDEVASGMGYFQRDYKGVTIENTDKPWLFASGCEGLLRIEAPLIEEYLNQPPGRYTVRLGFAAPPSDQPGSRVFDVRIQGNPLLVGFDAVEAAGGSNKAIVREFQGIEVQASLVLEFVPQTSDPLTTQAPRLNFIEILREDVENLPVAVEVDRKIDPPLAQSMLREGEEKWDEGCVDEALALYHSLLRSSAPAKAKVKALENMAAIASPKSLAPLKSLWESAHSILSGYKRLERDVLAGTVRTCFSIAGRLPAQDRWGALKALNSLVPIVHELPDAHLRKEVLDKLGFMVNWRILGPIPWREGQAEVREVFASEELPDSEKDYPLGEKKLSWRKYEGYRPVIDLQEAFRARNRVFAFAYGEIHLNESMPLLLKVGSDDGFKCWFNGEYAGGYDGIRSWRIDETAVRVMGRRGKNALCLMIIEGKGNWAFSVRVTDPHGFPIGW